MLSRLFLIVAIAALFGCSSGTRQLHSHQVVFPYRSDPQEFGDTFDWQARSPVEFLEVLKTRETPYVVVGTHHDWIRDTDVIELMSRLDSEVPCAPVISAFSSSVPTERSTEGREAAFLLEGYRAHFYPPELTSAESKPDRNELQSWFNKWKMLYDKDQSARPNQSAPDAR